MRRPIAAACVLVSTSALLVAGFAGTASAAPKNPGAACAQAGIGFLKANDLFKAAATRQIDYSTIADAEAGPIFADLPPGSFLSLGQVVKLHHTNPELFAWCATP